MLIIKTQQEFAEAELSDILLNEEEIILKDLYNITFTKFNSPKLKKLYCFNVRRLELENHSLNELYLFWCDYELNIEHCKKLEQIKVFESPKALELLTALQLSDSVRILTIEEAMNAISPLQSNNEDLVQECSEKIKMAHELYQELLVEEQVENQSAIRQQPLNYSESIFSEVCDEESLSEIPDNIETLSSKTTQGSNMFASRQISLIPLKKIEVTNPSVPEFISFENAYEQAFIEETMSKESGYPQSKYYETEIEIEELEEELSKIMQQHQK